MSTFNELYLEILDLEKKIEYGPKNKLKRKLMLKNEIKELEEEKRKAGLHYDQASVQKFSAQISKLKDEIFIDHVYNYKSQLKSSRTKLLDLIVEYSKKGYNIDDIFQIDCVSDDIQNDLLNKSNFGKTTGFLFVEEINDDENYNWRYYNPISDFEYKSETLDNLENQIKYHDEIFLIFDEELSNKSQNRDLKLCRIKIDEYIFSLKDCGDIDDIFKNLNRYRDKFSEKQITAIHEFLLEDTIDYDFVIDFIDILEVNLDEVDGNTIDKIYLDIIDIGINRLNNPDKYNLDNIIDCLKKLSYHFCEKQIIDLCNFLTKNSRNYVYFQKVNSIFEDYVDKSFLNKIYHYIIDDGITKVIASNSYNLDVVVKCLIDCSDYFSKSQIIKLFDSPNLFEYFSGFNTILCNNRYLKDNEVNNIYFGIINEGINLLDYSKRHSHYQIFSCFRLISDKFSKDQIKCLYNYILDDIKYFDDFNIILNDNSDEFSQDEMDDIYCGLIDGGIEKLKNPNINRDEISYVFDYLNSYSFKFSSKQIHELCAIVIDDIYGFNKGFISILEDNSDKFDDVYERIIDQRINALMDLDLRNTRSKYLIGGFMLSIK